MKKSLYIVVLCLIVGVQSAYSGDNPIKGTWVNEKYLSILNRSRSPYKAQQIIGNESRCIIIDIGDKNTKSSINFIIGIKENKYVFDSLIGNKDTYMGYYLQSDGKKRDSVMMAKRDNVLEITQWKNGNAIRSIYNTISNKPSVSALELHIHSLLLSGKYTDDKNNIYEFADDGTCVWVGRKGKCSIGFNFTSTKNDYVQVQIAGIEKKKDTANTVKKVPTLWVMEKYKDRLVLRAVSNKEKDTEDAQLILFRAKDGKPDSVKK